MLLKESKKIEYFIKAIKTIHGGASSTGEILEVMTENQAYVLKILTELKKIGIINRDFELSKPFDQIMVSDLFGSEDELSTVDKMVLDLLKTVPIASIQ